MYSHSQTFSIVCILLAASLAFLGCAVQVVVSQPFHEKLRIGDGIKITVKDGTVHSGRIVYLDRGSVVIRTPKQTKAKSPVEVAIFGTTVPWSEVVRVKVSGTLDSQRKLISNEEIRINRRTNHRRNFGINTGLLGTGLSFLAGAYIQDKISPPTIDVTNFRHEQGRAVFWSTFITGTVASALLGYKWGDHLDRNVAIARIERQRQTAREALKASRDTLNNAKNLNTGSSPLKF